MENEKKKILEIGNIPEFEMPNLDIDIGEE